MRCGVAPVCKHVGHGESSQDVTAGDLETIFEHDTDIHGIPLMIPYDGDLDTDSDDDDDRDLLSLIDSRFYDPNCPTESLLRTEDIDFEFVYALHTFVATVEGQANATKGDTMVLLDDSNSYWWLVRVVKDSSIGKLHIPLSRDVRLLTRSHRIPTSGAHRDSHRTTCTLE